VGSPPDGRSPPPPVQQGAPAALVGSMAGVITGRLALQGLTVTGAASSIGFDGTATPSTDPAAATALASNLMVRQNKFAGSLVLAVTGQELLWPAAQVEVRRALVWSYSSSLEAFTASVALYGQLTVAVMTNATGVWGLQAGSAQVVCTVGGEVVLCSKAYPGPGLSGNYTWAGTLTMIPDPWARLGLQSVQDGAAAQPAATVATGRHLLHSAAGRQMLEAGPVGRRLLVTDGDSGTWGVGRPVYGAVGVTEAGATTSQPRRKGIHVLLDADGEVVLAGPVPEALVPPERGSTHVTKFIPLWLYLAGAAAVLLVLCSVGTWWVLVLRKRQARERLNTGSGSSQPAAAAAPRPPKATRSTAHSSRGPANRRLTILTGASHGGRRHSRRVSDVSGHTQTPPMSPARSRSPAAWQDSSRRSSQAWWDADGATASPPITPHGRHPHQQQPPSRQQQWPRSPAHQQPPSRGQFEGAMNRSSTGMRPGRQQAWAENA
jgi:hypothetical protein